MQRLEDYKNVHPLVKVVFEEAMNSKKLTGDPASSEMVKRYSIDFLENPYRTRKTSNEKLSLAQEILVEQEINELSIIKSIKNSIKC